MADRICWIKTGTPCGKCLGCYGLDTASISVREEGHEEESGNQEPEGLQESEGGGG